MPACTEEVWLASGPIRASRKGISQAKPSHERPVRGAVFHRPPAIIRWTRLCRSLLAGNLAARPSEWAWSTSLPGGWLPGVERLWKSF